jgi:hypothetical protein
VGGVHLLAGFPEGAPVRKARFMRQAGQRDWGASGGRGVLQEGQVAGLAGVDGIGCLR